MSSVANLYLQDAILVYLYSLIGVSSSSVLAIAKDMREGGFDVADEEIKRQAEILRRKGFLSFTMDYVNPPAQVGYDDPLWVTGEGCKAAEAIILRDADAKQREKENSEEK